MTNKLPPPRLITIAVSHYCEKARWALDHAGLDYVEEVHVPLLHRRHARRAGGSTVPVLVGIDGACTDSAAILRYADAHTRTTPLLPRDSVLRQEALDLELFLDRELGTPARRWAYGGLLADLRLLQTHFTAGVPRAERLLAPLVVRLARPMIRRGYRVSTEGTQRSLERLHAVFRDIDARLADGRRYLVGEHFGVADLTFASLAAPLLLPDGYGGSLPRIEDVPESMRVTVEEFRGTAAGRFALAMYATHRRP